MIFVNFGFEWPPSEPAGAPLAHSVSQWCLFDEIWAPKAAFEQALLCNCNLLLRHLLYYCILVPSDAIINPLYRGNKPLKGRFDWSGKGTYSDLVWHDRRVHFQVFL